MNLTKLQDTKSQKLGYRNHLHFYILTMKNQKEKLSQSHSPLQQKDTKENYNTLKKITRH